MLSHGSGGFFVLGGIVLAVTGVEALYADMSHFGRRPIVLAWYVLVFPALVLCYVGESARILQRPGLLANPLYALTPGWTLYPAIATATVATVIASQALISGAFTLAEQATRRTKTASPSLPISVGSVTAPMRNYVVSLKLQRGANPTVAECDRIRIDRVTPSLNRIVAHVWLYEAAAHRAGHRSGAPTGA